MSVVQINEYRCDLGCGTTYQTEERWLPDQWLVIEFKQWGKSGEDKRHICPSCVPKFKAALRAEA